jgi:protein SCO1/2
MMTLTTTARPWLAGLLLLSGVAFADEAGTQALHHTHIPTTATRYTVDYVTPQVHLVRADGRSIWLPDELDDGRPVVLDFVYTTCTAICPVSSQTFSELEKRLGADRGRVHLVSVSIDPEEDTPERLSQYSRHYDAGPQWSFYTGTLDASESVQRAFRVFRGNKMSHDPVTLVRLAPGRPWVRFDGFATAQELLAELRN